MTNQDKIQAYVELLNVADKYPAVFKGNYSIRTLTEELEALKISELFKLELTSAGNKHYNITGSYDNWTRVLFFGKDYGRSIGWSDDDRQPENEWLYVIEFTTGPFIFGEEYPTQTFQKFFNELKSFGPKYSDTVNKCLYFTSENAYKVHAAWKELFLKYKAQVQDELKAKRKQELEEELAKLSQE